VRWLLTRLQRRLSETLLLTLDLFAHGLNRRLTNLRHRHVQRPVSRARRGHGAFELPHQLLLLLPGQALDLIAQYLTRSLRLDALASLIECVLLILRVFPVSVQEPLPRLIDLTSLIHFAADTGQRLALLACGQPRHIRREHKPFVTPALD
jgi:hypothetical protein